MLNYLLFLYLIYFLILFIFLVVNVTTLFYRSTRVDVYPSYSMDICLPALIVFQIIVLILSYLYSKELSETLISFDIDVMVNQYFLYSLILILSIVV